MLLRAKDDQLVFDIIKQKTHRYTDHHIQNELLHIIALRHLYINAAEIRQVGFLALESDEVTEQEIVCSRWVDWHIEPHKDFIGLHHVDGITADTVFRVLLKDTVLHMNLNLSVCRAQCFDGASNMKKVAKEIKCVQPVFALL